MGTNYDGNGAKAEDKRTFPISGAHVTDIWFGTADDNLTRDVMFKGLPGLFCSMPFLGGGA